MRNSLAVGIVALVCTTASANISVMDNDKKIDVDCAKDPEVMLIGNHLTVTLKGVCARVSITGNHEVVTGSATVVDVQGNHNAVTLSAADDVAIAGNSNTVSVKKAVKLKAPRIANTGNDNKVSAGT